MGSVSGSIRQIRLFSRAWTALLYVSFLSSAGISWAQAECGVATATPLRVKDKAGVDMLRAAAQCTDGHTLEAAWAGVITLDAPIMVASGMFLSITGEDTLAEVSGGYQTRMFEVSPGGELTLTQLKLSGGNETSGGAIYSNSSALILDNCLFRDNVATDGDGGAVWADGGSVTILGGEFLGNNATGNGGAVAATGAKISLVVQQGSIFVGNSASVGGALYCSGVAESSSATSCSLSDIEFTSNIATLEPEGRQGGGGGRGYEFSAGVDGGGAVGLQDANATISDSVFVDNHARQSGGALLGGTGTDITVNGCKFENNTADTFGGAIAAASMSLAGNTQLINNLASWSGGAVFGWNSSGTITFHDVACTQNAAVEGGGCFYGAGRGMFNNGTVMNDNHAKNGGCLYSDDSEFHVLGGEFTCRSSRRGGFYFAEGVASLNITGGLIAGNEAGTRGGAISSTKEATLTIGGGTFSNNSALELGGAIYTTETLSSMQITGGVFSHNTATYFGGSVYLDGLAYFTCEGAAFRENYAGDQGGGMYVRHTAVVNSSCDFIANRSPQGAALYLASVGSALFENHDIAGNVAYSGSVVYITSSSVVVANNVTFKSGVDLQKDSFNRAVQSERKSAVTFKECVFDGWLGDTVIYHENPKHDSLCLDSCDFTRSSTIVAVSSLTSDAKIRNAVVGDVTFANAGRLNRSLPLVDHALDCSSPNICGPGKCMNSTLGVLCECLDADTCLNDGSEVSLRVKTPPARETYSPKPVSFDLVVSSAVDGSTYTIWDLAFGAKGMDLDVAPSNGVLPPGGNVTVVVTGTIAAQGMGGNLTSSFNLTSVGNTNSSSNAGVEKQDVNSPFYLCSAHNFSKLSGLEHTAVSCQPCISIRDEGEGVNCTAPGATLVSLPILPGYWRSGVTSTAVHKCRHRGACIGGTDITSPDEYCANGYQGPYCAVCSEGHARGARNDCHSCDNTNARLFIWMGIVASVGLLLLLVILAVVFLVGGLDAVDIVRKSVNRNVFVSKKASKVWSASQTSTKQRHHRNRGASKDFISDIIAPAFDFTWESQYCASNCDTGNSSGESSRTRTGPDNAGKAYVQPSSAVVGAGASVVLSPSDVPAEQAIDVGMPARPHARQCPAAGKALDRSLVNGRGRLRANNGGGSKCCGLGVNIKRWASRLPLHKFKILLVVWQILTVFSSITGVEFPESYALFLSWINVVNFDIGHIFSVSCILPSANFYARLLVTTLMPLVVAAGLMLTYHVAKRRAGIGSAGVIARRAAWSRHVAAGLLLTFLVFTSTSTLVFKTFACDDAIEDGKSYLRADYRLTCESRWHIFFKGYAIIMIMVYPIGIPALYAVILWGKRELLNPRLQTAAKSEPGATDGAATRADSADGVGIFSWFLRTMPKVQTKTELSLQELRKFKERVRARREHPELVPSMFLWKDFGPELFYYEVLECGRRMLLTGVLIFISPNSTTQVAVACVFAFGTLLGFELLRPHLDPGDLWLYRLGCVVIFLSYFLALLMKVGATGEDGGSALASVLIAINVMMVLSVLLAFWFTVRQTVDNTHNDDGTIALMKAIQTTEQNTPNTPGSHVMEAL